MADFLRLKNMVFFAYHGIKDSEVMSGQRFEVDVELETDLYKPSISDDLHDTYNYEIVYNIVSEVVSETRFNLIEGLAGEICNRIHEVYPTVTITVKVRKPHVVVSGVLDAAEVQITRKGINKS